MSEMNILDCSPIEENLAILYLDLFQGGSETTGALVEWIILFMALNPEKQSKLQAEIDTVLPKMLPCSMDHRDRCTHKIQFIIIKRPFLNYDFYLK